jgi:hypothetical protein
MLVIINRPDNIHYWALIWKLYFTYSAKFPCRLLHRDCHGSTRSDYMSIVNTGIMSHYLIKFLTANEISHVWTVWMTFPGYKEFNFCPPSNYTLTALDHWQGKVIRSNCVGGECTVKAKSSRTLLNKNSTVRSYGEMEV